MSYLEVGAVFVVALVIEEDDRVFAPLIGVACVEAVEITAVVSSHGDQERRPIGVGTSVGRYDFLAERVRFVIPDPMDGSIDWVGGRDQFPVTRRQSNSQCLLCSPDVVLRYIRLARQWVFFIET